jgi:SAM-dependent methyltransferase
VGFDVTGIIFAKITKDSHGKFGRTATIGRQGIHIPQPVLEDLLQVKYDYEQGDFAEGLLTKFFGSDLVESFDNSPYEGATHIVDLNHPIPDEFCDQYDTVIDAGSLEHIFDTKLAFENVSKMLKPGGQILHLSPGNNRCGHGFYQFSPEFFFSIYSTKRGFSRVEVFVARESDRRNWYRVSKPSNGERAELYSFVPVECLVRAVKSTSSEILNADVQQSDYIYLWEDEKADQVAVKKTRVTPIKDAIKRNQKVFRLALLCYHFVSQTQLFQIYRYQWKKGLNARNRWLTKIRVDSDFT